MGQPRTRHPAIYAAHLVRLVARFGVPERALLDGTGLTLAGLESVDEVIDGQLMNELIRRALKLTREPALGFHMGMQVKLSAHGAVGLAAMTSSTFGESIDVVERFFPLREGHVGLIVRRDDPAWVVLVLEPYEPLDDLEEFVMTGLVSGLGQMAGILLGEPLRGAITLRMAEPTYFSGYAHLVPGSVRFGARENTIALPTAMMHQPLRLSDEVARREAVARCEHELASLRETSAFLATVLRQLRNRDRGYLTLSELARVRGVSERSLKRHLAEHGTTYRELLDRLRRDQSVRLLETTDRTVEAIALELGYADVANFRRAFRRWLGVAPAELRGGARR